jgi:hypothetical protein
MFFNVIGRHLFSTKWIGIVLDLWCIPLIVFMNIVLASLPKKNSLSGSCILTNFFMLLCVFGLLTSTLLNAVVFTVSNTNDSGAGSLREAIAAANNAAANDSIVDASNVSGTIQLQDSLSITAPMEIKGPGAQDLTISGDKNGNSQHDDGDRRPIYIDNNGGVVQIRGVTISGGYALLGIGGGIFNRSGILTIEACIITDNFSDRGTGGGVASWAELNIVSSTIVNNTATDAWLMTK